MDSLIKRIEIAKERIKKFTNHDNLKAMAVSDEN